jgi:uncharacterized MAPEG superfamily protein
MVKILVEVIVFIFDATSARTSGASRRPDVPRDHPIEITGLVQSHKKNNKNKRTYPIQ